MKFVTNLNEHPNTKYKNCAFSREKKTVSAHLHSIWGPQLDLMLNTELQKQKFGPMAYFFSITKSWKLHNLEKTYYSTKFLSTEAESHSA